MNLLRLPRGYEAAIILRAHSYNNVHVWMSELWLGRIRVKIEEKADQ